MTQTACYHKRHKTRHGARAVWPIGLLPESPVPSHQARCVTSPGSTRTAPMKRSFFFAVFENLYLTQPLFRRFLALVWTAQVLSFARCDLVAFFHLFDHFTLAIFHEDVANSWVYVMRGRCGLGKAHARPRRGRSQP